MATSVTLRFFASIREAIGEGTQPWTTSAADLSGLRDELIARGDPYAQCLARGKSVRIALNQAMCDESTALSAGAEIAFFPPVTGG